MSGKYLFNQILSSSISRSFFWFIFSFVCRLRCRPLPIYVMQRTKVTRKKSVRMRLLFLNNGHKRVLSDETTNRSRNMKSIVKRIAVLLTACTMALPGFSQSREDNRPYNLQKAYEVLQNDHDEDHHCDSTARSMWNMDSTPFKNSVIKIFVFLVFITWGQAPRAKILKFLIFRILKILKFLIF